jgi:hypothetical protein
MTGPLTDTSKIQFYSLCLPISALEDIFHAEHFSFVTPDVWHAV